jgi:hypothetical protein
MTENITPAQQAMEAWHGKVKLDRAVMLELYLDKLTLAEGSVRGVAFLRDAEQLTPLAVNGKLRGEQIAFALSGIGGDEEAIFSFKGERTKSSLIGELSAARGKSKHPLRLAKYRPEKTAPPPVPSNSLPEPDIPIINIYYTVTTNLGDFNLGDWSIPLLLVPTGSWRGPGLWGTNTGLATVVLDPFAWHLNFTLTTWNPLSVVAHFYIDRSGLDFDKPMDLLAGSDAYPTDHWVPVTGKLTMRRSN